MWQNIPNSVVSDSAASRNSVVAMALALSGLMGTSVKLLFRPSKKVPPGGCATVEAIVKVEQRTGSSVVGPGDDRCRGGAGDVANRTNTASSAAFQRITTRAPDDMALLPVHFILPYFVLYVACILTDSSSWESTP